MWVTQVSPPGLGQQRQRVQGSAAPRFRPPAAAAAAKCCHCRVRDTLGAAALGGAGYELYEHHEKKKEREQQQQQALEEQERALREERREVGGWVRRLAGGGHGLQLPAPRPSSLPPHGTHTQRRHRCIALLAHVPNPCVPGPLLQWEAGPTPYDATANGGSGGMKRGEPDEFGGQGQGYQQGQSYQQVSSGDGL